MQVRLAFSVAIKAQGDILVLDEVLAVGDEAFQKKCDRFFKQVKDDPTKTIILVTHSMNAVKKYCNKAILIKDGEIVASGEPKTLLINILLKMHKNLISIKLRIQKTRIWFAPKDLIREFRSSKLRQ